MIWFVFGAILLVTGYLVIDYFVVLPNRIAARNSDTFRSIAKAVELRFPLLAGITDHSLELCKTVSKDLGLSSSEISTMCSVLYLRRIGLCQMPYQVLNTKHPRDWTHPERNQFEQHLEVGAAMLDQIPNLAHFATYLRDHDELHCQILDAIDQYVWTYAKEGPATALQEVKKMRALEPSSKAIQSLENVISLPTEMKLNHRASLQ